MVIEIIVESIPKVYEDGFSRFDIDLFSKVKVLVTVKMCSMVSHKFSGYSIKADN